MDIQSIKGYTKKIRILYPIWIAVAIFSVAFVPMQIFIKGDIAQTNINLAENDFLFRLSIMGSILTQILHAYIPFYLYLIFKEVNKSRALVMLVLAMVSIPLTMGFDLFKIAILDITEPNMIYDYLHLSQTGLIISSFLWGLWLFPLGRLVIESKYMPKVLAYLLIISCFGYILGSIIKIGFPEMKTMLKFAEALTFGEVLFAVWFIIKGLSIKGKL